MYKTFRTEDIQKYRKFLSNVAALSKIFSASDKPLIHYRAVESIFCHCFQAEDLSRSDIAIDALRDRTGIGIKTFVKRGSIKQYEKIAEFNSDRNSYNDLDTMEKIKRISELRNKRLELALNLYNIDELIYHCIVRDSANIIIIESDMPTIDIENINITATRSNTIKFDDGIKEYSFNMSKSTLYCSFDTTDENKVDHFGVTILDNPMEFLDSLDFGNVTMLESEEFETIYLPLYTYERNTNNKCIAERSGLNQWNANGRLRNENEAYIPIPLKFRQSGLVGSFLPTRGISFGAYLPNGEIMQMKVCQEGNKALMSSPNKDLGKWLLRDVLNISTDELITMAHLTELGIDSIRIDKYPNGIFKINFATLDSYELFKVFFD